MTEQATAFRYTASCLADQHRRAERSPIPKHLNHDRERVFPENHRVLRQALRESGLGAIQETRNMGEGQLHSPFTSSGGVVLKPCTWLMHVAIHLGHNCILHRVGHPIHPQRRSHRASHVRCGSEA